MRCFLAGLSFAALVALAIGTATIRAENTIRRHTVERRYAELRDREVERQRLEAELFDRDTERRLAALHRLHLEGELARREMRLQ